MAQTLKQAILDDPEDFELPSSETNLREAFLNMAQHMAALEEQLKETEEANQPVEKSEEELEALVAKIRKAAISGIRKQTYDTLSIVDKSNVNIRWNEATGEFKFSGSYGTA
ncbi:hypothetical protein M422DRAFT_781082 [Sphaerobolus stellatus SS14]|uniref:Uncharacterized protein n=1 Tax=Sphaerobolus stellatus (strain SS14) TaxID=990650 RepID=A0A0C9U8X2_SPHS4|nr:hypothetical protein M422DRAFT_781082 [Sphaerobolus stellatus SS14]